MLTIEPNRARPQRSDSRPAAALTGMGALSETQLMGRLRTGAEDALQELVRRHGPRLLARARRILADEEEARSATREALSATLAGLDGVAGPAELAEVLEANLLEAALRWLRRTPSEVPMGDLLPAFDADGHFARAPRAFGPLPAAPFAHGLMQSQVRGCVHELPADYRAAFLLCDVEGLSATEAARYLGVGPAEIERRLHVARQGLTSLLAPFFAPSEPLRRT